MCSCVCVCWSAGCASGVWPQDHRPFAIYLDRKMTPQQADTAKERQQTKKSRRAGAETPRGHDKIVAEGILRLSATGTPNTTGLP